MKIIIRKILRRLNYYKNNIVWGSKGRKTKIKSPIRIIGKKNIFLGNKVSILNNARIEAINYWNGKEYNPKIVIKDNVNIGQNLHLTCAKSVVINEKVSILPNVLITDIEHQYIINKCISETEISTSGVEIGKFSTIGAGSVILGGKEKIIIGKNVVIGANTVVTHSIPDNSIAVGIPAKVIKKMRGMQ